MAIDVYGLSPDDIDSHKAFAKKHDLNFPLIADPDHVLLEKLGIWGEKEWDGKKFMGTTRTTLLVGEDGKVEHLWEDVAFEGHAAEVQAHCESMLF